MTPATATILRPPGVIAELIGLLQASPVSSDETLIRWGLLPWTWSCSRASSAFSSSGGALSPNGSSASAGPGACT